ncbi:hypothetical protein DFH06DRAFT_1327058 [Mycena polygramma]|nr:hypothetical protein DFH06DRAFT_1327058 [Mycena polygramma]
MGKLNIAHHKSYHPYRHDNIEKVRRDEEEAYSKEAREQGRAMLADSKARINQLRDYAVYEGPASPSAILKTPARKSVSVVLNPSNNERGFPLAPSTNDLRPWYTSKTSQPPDDGMDNRRKRDAATKSVYDPLTIMRQLASPPRPSGPPKQRYRAPAPPNSDHSSDVQTRLSRESSERQRALALIRPKRHNEPPEIRHKDGYGDLFNRQEVEEARRRLETQDREGYGRR